MDLADLGARARRWIADDPDPQTRDELSALLAHPDVSSTDLADRFTGSLEFGTAGLRGILGAGPNRMNRAVVARTSWGLAREVLARVPGAAERGVVVGRDARRMSREFAEDAAAILAAAGLRVVLFDGPVPTPLVGFAVKLLGAAAGVVVTASHNPPEYNGYKVYWENAAQIVPPVDARIAAAIARAPSARDVERPALQTLRATGLVVDAPTSVTDAYVAAIRGLADHPSTGDRSFPIVYTPLHGVGDAIAHRALREAGFTQVTSVPEQKEPDGAFPTVAFPNPEEPGTMDLALALAAKSSAELVLANDPDADRLAVAVRSGGTSGGTSGETSGGTKDGGHQQLSGNDLGVLLGHYLLTERGPSAAPRGRVVVASIVSSPLLGRIAADLGARYEETLTGFKWIASRAIELGAEGYEFLFGYEEALGYCVGDVVYDKDGISAAALMAEVTAVLLSRGKTPLTELDAIARRWGTYASAQVTVTRKGAAGIASIGRMMDALRAAPPRGLAGDEVVAISDYQAGRRTELRGRGGSASSGAGAAPSTPLVLPKSNVLTFELSSGSRIIARPSGTEPKAKFYLDVPADSRPRAAARLGALKTALENLVAELGEGPTKEPAPGA
jgi:phosphomannomutase